MKILYTILICVLMVFMNYFVICTLRKKNPLAKALRQLVTAVTITVIFSILTLFVPTKEAALFLQSLHYISTEWLLIFLLRFLERYTEDMWSKKSAKLIIYSIAIINSISLLLNAIFHHVVVCEYKDIGNGELYYDFTTLHPGYSIHLYFTYFLVACNILVLVGQSIRAAKLYRNKYLVALLMLCLTFAMDAICTIKDYPLDYSLYAYVLLAIFFTYYSIYHVPQGLITKTLSYVIDDSSDGVVCFDALGKCIYANEEAMCIYGNPSELFELESVFKEELGNIDFIKAADKKWERKYIIDENDKYFDMTFGKLYDVQKSYIGCYFLIHDKTQDMEKLEKERYRSAHDMLTGLYNREYFYEHVHKQIEETPEEEYSMICTNIKDFKLINDLFGTKMGDAILIRLAQTMNEYLPAETISARMESDHFAFFMPTKLIMEQKLLQGIHEVTKMISSSEYQMVIHVGIYEIRDNDQNVPVMCDRANIAISTIKDDYDHIIAYYDEQLMERVIREKRLVSEFDRGMDEGQFVMYLQPQVAPDGTVLGAEALVRWLHPEQGMISPGEFISVFEKVGLIYRLDRYIWEQAARKLKEWKDNGHENLHISVNISTKDFYYLDIYKTFVELVEKYDISPDKLKLEITETALMMDLEKQLVLLDKLQSYGFQVEIDDFGSGYSSLNMLKDIHADVLKIDMGFLRQTKNNERTAIILRMIIGLAKQLEMIVITEGVESKEQVEHLTQIGSDMFQGYYFARPIAVSEFETRYISA